MNDDASFTAKEYTARAGITDPTEIDAMLALLRSWCEAKDDSDPYRMCPNLDMADRAIAEIIAQRPVP